MKASVEVLPSHDAAVQVPAQVPSLGALGSSDAPQQPSENTTRGLSQDRSDAGITMNASAQVCHRPWDDTEETIEIDGLSSADVLLWHTLLQAVVVMILASQSIQTLTRCFVYFGACL